MPKNQVLNTRISARDLDVLKRAAELEGISTSAFVTRAACATPRCCSRAQTARSCPPTCSPP